MIITDENNNSKAPKEKKGLLILSLIIAVIFVIIISDGKKSESKTPENSKVLKVSDLKLNAGKSKNFAKLKTKGFFPYDKEIIREIGEEYGRIPVSNEYDKGYRYENKNGIFEKYKIDHVELFFNIYLKLASYKIDLIFDITDEYNSYIQERETFYSEEKQLIDSFRSSGYEIHSLDDIEKIIETDSEILNLSNYEEIKKYVNELITREDKIISFQSNLIGKYLNEIETNCILNYQYKLISSSIEGNTILASYKNKRGDICKLEVITSGDSYFGYTLTFNLKYSSKKQIAYEKAISSMRKAVRESFQ